LSTNHYQIELLTNLDQVPEAGAIVVVSFPKPKAGSGFPARVFAILP
jgi:kynurenine formamidase